MLAIVEPEHLDAVLELAKRWEVRSEVVGRVTDTGRFRVFNGVFDAWGVPGEAPAPPPGDEPLPISSDRAPEADVPAGSLGDGPVYHRPREVPADLDARQAADPAPFLRERFGAGTDLSRELLALLATPTIAEKRWVWSQYDHQLFLNTVVGPGADAAVLRVKGTKKALALSTDGKARFCKLDPRTGGRLVVIEAARNVACAGGEPLGFTDCLNFGNPEKPGPAWQLDRAVSGLAEACEALEVPVVGGNVSLYNETEHGPIYPTPVVGMVGELPDPAVTAPAAFADGDRLFLVGPFAPSLAGSELAKLRGELDAGLPSNEIAPVASALELMRELVRDGTARGAHDVSDGGLACALAEMAIAGRVGAALDLDPLIELRGCSGETALFGEGPGGIVISVAASAAEEVVGRAGSAGVDAVELGTAGGERLEIEAAEREVSLLVADAERAWRALDSLLNG
ncbi:MAG: AIR synthase-related protein, partial [Solirubrobacterales bacterium]